MNLNSHGADKRENNVGRHQSLYNQVPCNQSIPCPSSDQVRLSRQARLLIFAALKCRPNENLNKKEKVLSLICNFNDVSFQ